MPGPNNEQVQTSRVERRIELGPLLIHNNHLSGGFKAARGCRVCEKGLAGAITETEEASPGPSGDAVVEGDGTDEKGSASSSRGDGSGAREDNDRLLDW